MFPSIPVDQTHTPYNDRDSVVEWYSTLFSLYGIPKDTKNTTIPEEHLYSSMKILGNDIIITPPGTETYNAIRIFNFGVAQKNRKKPYAHVKCRGTGTTVVPDGEPGDPISLTVDIVIDLSDARQMRYGDNYRYELTASTINMYTKATATVNQIREEYEQTSDYAFDTCDIAFIIDTKTDIVTPLYFNLVFTSTWGDHTAKITASSDGMTTEQNRRGDTKHTFLRMDQSSTITKIIAYSDGEIPYETHPIPITLKGSRDTFRLQLLDYKGDVINPIRETFNTLFAVQYFIADKDDYA